ncbi:MAG: fused MFS/spermidine synthase [Hydrococcus sp. Prado102]|jgi:predicted membrane-bound spermidine synthase|nr:fused MFS/spermidine synthase [Hydrococcus sp. Prado102]
MLSPQSKFKISWAKPALFAIFFISGFTALLYQVVWQRMLGLFSGSDVRSVTIIVAAYLAGLGVGSLLGGIWSDRLSNRQIVRVYGFCNLGIAVFAVFSRFLFYDLLFLELRYLARSPAITLLIAFLSLLIPTILMGLSLPLLSKALGRSALLAASRIGWLYGINTLGSGLGSFVGGWYIVGSFGYEKTVYLGAFLNAVVALVAIASSSQFKRDYAGHTDKSDRQDTTITSHNPSVAPSVTEWCFLVFLSGFTAISLEIIWFRVLDIALQSNAYTYAHLLAFILISNAIGSMLGAKAVRFIRRPRRVFLSIQGIVAAYSAIAIWLIGLYWQSHPNLREDIGYIDPNNITAAVVFKYLVLPLVMIVLPNLLLGFYFPLVQKAIQTDDRAIGRRVGLILVANILGNTTGSLVTGLILLDRLGTSTSLRLLVLLGLGFVIAIRPNWMRAKFISVLALILIATVVFFPSNTRLWASLHGIKPQDYFILAEDSTGVAAIAQTNQHGTLFASGQAQANFPYLHVHALLGTIPALLHPNPAQITIIGLGSGGTPHTIGANPLTTRIRIVEIMGAELPVLKEYSTTPIGKPLKYLFQDPRYQIDIGDGRRELVLSERKFDIIEADAIQPWRSRAGMLYSQEFFQEVRSRLAPGGFFVEWNVGSQAQQTFRNVFPFVTQLDLTVDLSILIGSDRPVEFDPEALLTKLESPAVLDFMAKAGVDVEAIRTDVLAAGVSMYSHVRDGQPQAINTDLFPRSEYYLNRSLR